MKYYVTADIHGFYTPFLKAITEAGFFRDEEPHKLIVCGDLFDRGKEALPLQSFIIDLIDKDEIVLIRGNHEDLFVEMLNNDGGMPFNYHLKNGTYDTALQLTGFDKENAFKNRSYFVEQAKQTPFYKSIIPSMKNFFEFGNYVFVHGWIPVRGESVFCKMPIEYYSDWRAASEQQWAVSRWENGMEVGKEVTEDGKTIVCGHWHCSYGHSRYEGRGSEFGPDADFTPYYGKGIIALDACTALSGTVNCLVLEN